MKMKEDLLLYHKDEEQLLCHDTDGKKPLH